MKRILVPTDFSPNADKALKVAVQIATKNACEIYVLHTMEIPMNLTNSTEGGSLPESLFYIKLAEKHFAELRERPFLKDVSFNEAIGRNEIFEDIQNTVENNQIDLIIMGSQGASGLKEMFIGSNTEKVVRTSKIPVLVIKHEYENFAINDFVFATDFNEDNRGAFKKAQDFAQMIGAKMHLLYVNTPADFKTTPQALAKMNDFVKGLVPEIYTMNIYNETTVEKGIRGFARNNNMNLIGMSTHGRQGISHFLNGSISEDLVNHTKMPVITFRI